MNKDKDTLNNIRQIVFDAIQAVSLHNLEWDTRLIDEVQDLIGGILVAKKIPIKEECWDH